MEKKFNVVEWINRCKTCKFSDISRDAKYVVCKLDGSCHFVKGCENKEKTFEDPEHWKRCSKCFRVNHITDMYKSYQNGSAVYRICKTCKNKMNKEYYGRKERMNGTG